MALAAEWCEAVNVLKRLGRRLLDNTRLLRSMIEVEYKMLTGVLAQEQPSDSELSYAKHLGKPSLESHFLLSSRLQNKENRLVAV